MNSWRTRSLALVLIGCMVCIMAALLFLGKAPAVVHWSQIRAIALESDDWGFCGFVPDTTALDGIDTQALATGYFPPVYWGSTLEDSAMVASLCELLKGYSGSDGQPPVFQANYIVSALAWQPGDVTGDDSGSWVRFDIPDLATEYRRPGLWRAVAAGMADRVWRPEYHGRFHYDPTVRKTAALAAGPAREATERGVAIFPGSEQAYEMGSQRTRSDLVAEMVFGRAIFTNLFGRPPVSIIAPDYVWDDRAEDIWIANGLSVIQAKREQRFGHRRRWGPMLRLRKVLDRTWARLSRLDRTYLERNCRLEPVQHAEQEQVVRSCYQEILAAWRRNEPAIVETHRINFAHGRRSVASMGRQAITSLLDRVTQSESGLPLFLSDNELAQLQRRGTSWSVRGGVVVVRNLTRGAKVVVVPAEAFAEAEGRLGDRTQQYNAKLILLPRFCTRILD